MGTNYPNDGSITYLEYGNEGTTCNECETYVGYGKQMVTCRFPCNWDLCHRCITKKGKEAMERAEETNKHVDALRQILETLEPVAGYIVPLWVQRAARLSEGRYGGYRAMPKNFFFGKKKLICPKCNGKA